MLPQISFSFLTIYFPLILSWIIFGATVFVFLRRREYLALYTVRLFYILICYRILYATLLSILQYNAWHNNPFSQYLLPPHQPFSYFLTYSGMHFWFYPALALMTALLVLFFFGALRKVNADWFLAGEISLGVLLTFLLGWPLSLFLVPMSFFGAVLLSLIAMSMKRGQHVSLGGVMLSVGGTLLVFGVFFLHLFH